MAKMTSALMGKQGRIRKGALVLLICLLLTAGMATAGTVRAVPNLQGIPASYQQVAENDLFQLHLDSTTLAFKVLDKRSGYLWHSGIDEVIEGDRLNRSWQAFAKSGISIEYLDEKAISKRISLSNTSPIVVVKPIDQGVSVYVTFADVGISLELILQLEAEGVRVEVPYTSIAEENSQFRLGQILLYPFMGATRGGTVPGYMFIPDGTGSLIHFAESTKAKNMFYGRYYGADLGMIATQPYDPRVNTPYPVTFPVFGMVHEEGQNAFLAVVEKGAAYAELQAHPAGIITNFNFLYNAFIHNQSYFQATNRSGAGVTTIQRRPNVYDVVVHYRFLTGEAADYVGMARSYQQYLVERGMLHKQDDPNPNIGIRLEFLGGDKEKVMFWHRFVPMTTIRQMGDILADLQIPNPQVIYFGWQPLGALSMPSPWLSLESALGSVDELRTLSERIKAEGGRFALYLDPQAALWGESGYSPRNDLAMAITGVNIEGYNRFYNNYFTYETLQWRYTTFVKDLAAQLTVGLALDSIGSNLYSDFRQGHLLNREETIKAYQALLSDSPLPLGFYRPNSYLWGQMQAYYDIPLGDNGYIYTTASVPFLPVVLAGYVPYYGPALNFSSNIQDDLLHHIDYGIYPSYFVTHEPTANMLSTASAWIYSSSYTQWGGPIKRTYQWLNDLLSPVRGQTIIARKQLNDGVFVTTYSSGKQIIVNYTDHPFVYEGKTVEAKNASLLEDSQ